MEIWCDVVGYEGLYQISNLGNVRSLNRGMYVDQDRYLKPRWVNRKGKLLIQHKDGSGYLMVRLCKLGKAKTLTVHRLVAQAFITNPANKPAVNHIDANIFNNKASNLEWCTIKENNAHTVALGRKKYKNGSMGMHVNLTSKQVRSIRILLRMGFHPKTLAYKFRCSRTNIIAVRDRRTWRHI